MAARDPPLLLLHGNSVYPCLLAQRLRPRLAEEFTVVLPDLRRLRRTVRSRRAAPIIRRIHFDRWQSTRSEVMKKLGFDKFYAAGHDRGARVSSSAVSSIIRISSRAAAFLDMLPQHHLPE